MVHSVSGWTWGVQVKLWDPLRTRAACHTWAPERCVHDKTLYKSTFTFTFTFTTSVRPTVAVSQTHVRMRKLRQHISLHSASSAAVEMRRNRSFREQKCAVCGVCCWLFWRVRRRCRSRHCYRPCCRTSCPSLVVSRTRTRRVQRSFWRGRHSSLHTCHCWLATSRYRAPSGTEHPTTT